MPTLKTAGVSLSKHPPEKTIQDIVKFTTTDSAADLPTLVQRVINMERVLCMVFLTGSWLPSDGPNYRLFVAQWVHELDTAAFAFYSKYVAPQNLETSTFPVIALTYETTEESDTPTDEQLMQDYTTVFMDHSSDGLSRILPDELAEQIEAHGVGFMDKDLESPSSFPKLVQECYPVPADQEIAHKAMAEDRTIPVRFQFHHESGMREWKLMFMKTDQGYLKNIQKRYNALVEGIITPEERRNGVATFFIEFKPHVKAFNMPPEHVSCVLALYLMAMTESDGNGGFVYDKVQAEKLMKA